MCGRQAGTNLGFPFVALFISTAHGVLCSLKAGEVMRSQRLGIPSVQSTAAPEQRALPLAQTTSDPDLQAARIHILRYSFDEPAVHRTCTPLRYTAHTLLLSTAGWRFTSRGV